MGATVHTIQIKVAVFIEDSDHPDHVPDWQARLDRLEHNLTGAVEDQLRDDGLPRPGMNTIVT